MSKRKLDPEVVDWRPNWEGENLKDYNEILNSARTKIASLRSLREALGLTQAEAAARLATSQSNVSKIEAKSDPSVSMLSRLLGDDGELELVAHLKDGTAFHIKIGG